MSALRREDVVPERGDEETGVRHAGRPAHGPCEIHRQHSYTIDPDGSLYACPGFATEAHHSVGHIDGRVDAEREKAAERFAVLDAWKACGDCSFIPVCAGGCTVAAATELGAIDQPSCHKAVIESAVESMAHELVAAG